MNQFLKWSIGISLGAVAGFLYWYYIGCTSGSCAITSSPINSSVYGAFLGVVVVNMFKKEVKQSEKQDPQSIKPEN